ncbi:alpha/beta hydrolase [Roseomonas sp. HJA6]|uniref:Alpha/beta hydrolase n=1 Tax=Roseomonas alba TaxID=2846776 RepID=A0ABS7A531_9PROT|nr:alpha/beta hydrolase [Neoroseomonas alba]MBW6397398.1 alpha/beta hydrolase [Neoroseomonas alba]
MPAKDLVVFYATNRRRISDAFDAISAEVPDNRRLWLGKAAVEMLGDPDRTEAPRHLLTHPEIPGDDDFEDPDTGAAAQVLDAWLDGAVSRQAVALFFVHGFANSFGSALERAAQVTEFYSQAVALAPFAFSWPSDGRVIDPQKIATGADAAIDQYKADQTDATGAGGALARLLREVHRARLRAKKAFGAPPRMVLLAHSMGNLALSAGLAVMRNGLLTADMAGTFDHAVLVASDVPNTALDPQEPLSEIAHLARAVTVVISRDNTLAIASRIANGGSRRLGHFGPAQLRVLPANVTVVDYFLGLQAPQSKPELFQVGGTEWDIVEHQYYRNDRKARIDLAQVLAGLQPSGRIPLPPGEQVDHERARHMILPFTGV